MFIYKIQNKIDGKSYIGKTVNDVNTRWNEHIRGKDKKSLIYRAINKYGKDNFEFSIIGTANSMDELNDLERFFIAEFNSLTPNGYNFTKGGDGSLGCIPSIETRMKMCLTRGRDAEDRNIKKLNKSYLVQITFANFKYNSITFSIIDDARSHRDKVEKIRQNNPLITQQELLQLFPRKNTGRHKQKYITETSNGYFRVQIYNKNLGRVGTTFKSLQEAIEWRDRTLKGLNNE